MSPARLLLVAILLTNAGCVVSSGTDFSPARADAIAVGKTMDDVRSLIGEPEKVAEFDGGRQVWSYRHRLTRPLWGRSTQRMLVVAFDRHGVVSAVDRSGS